MSGNSDKEIVGEVVQEVLADIAREDRATDKAEREYLQRNTPHRED